MFQIKTSQSEWLKLISNFGVRQITGCVFVILLMPLNWALEAKKWQLLLYKIHKTNFADSYKSVLLGATLGNLSPLMIGDFVGRLLGIPKNSKTKALSALLLSNGMQMFVLIVFAKMGYEILFYSTDAVETTANIFLRHLLTGLIVIGVLFFSKSINLPRIQSVKFLYLLNRYSKNAIISLFIWAFVRHLVFTLQFVVLLITFDIELPFYLLIGLVNIVFLFKTLGATLGMFGDIVSRQLTAAYFFGLYGVIIEPVLAAATMLWIINIFVPMFIGAFFVFSTGKTKLNKI